MVARRGRGCARPVGGAQVGTSTEVNRDDGMGSDIRVNHDDGVGGNSARVNSAKCYDDIAFQLLVRFRIRYAVSSLNKVNNCFLFSIYRDHDHKGW